jgi:membrane protein
MRESTQSEPHGYDTIKSVIVIVYSELQRTRSFVVAAALAFYFLLSLIPILMIFSALLGYLPVPHLFDQLLDMLATLVPPEDLNLVEKILASVFKPNRGPVLFFGLLSYLWTASGGFTATIQALNIAYDVERERSWWRERLQAVLLALTTGTLGLLSLFALVTGPNFGHFLTELFPIPHQFAMLWPVLRLAITFGTFVFGIEILYYLGPNRRQRFLTTFPGAVAAVIIWSLGSWCFNFYLAHFANYNKTYGSFGAVIVLMLWFYIVALAIIIGAEANAEYAKLRAARRRRREADDPFNRPIPGVHGA